MCAFPCVRPNTPSTQAAPRVPRSHRKMVVGDVALETAAEYNEADARLAKARGVKRQHAKAAASKAAVEEEHRADVRRKLDAIIERTAKRNQAAKDRKEGKPKPPPAPRGPMGEVEKLKRRAKRRQAKATRRHDAARKEVDAMWRADAQAKRQETALMDACKRRVALPGTDGHDELPHDADIPLLTRQQIVVPTGADAFAVVACSDPVPRVSAGELREDPMTAKTLPMWKGGHNGVGRLPVLEKVLESAAATITTGPLSPLNLPSELAELPMPPTVQFEPSAALFAINGGFMPGALPGLGAVSAFLDAATRARTHVEVPTGLGCAIPSMLFMSARAAPGLVSGSTITPAGKAFIVDKRDADIDFWLRFHAKDGTDAAAARERYSSVGSALDMDPVTWHCAGRTVAGIVAEVVRVNCRDTLGDLSPVVANVSRVLSTIAVLMPATKDVVAKAIADCKALVGAWVLASEASPVVAKRVRGVMAHGGKAPTAPPRDKQPWGYKQAMATAVAIGHANALLPLLTNTWAILDDIEPDFANPNTAAGMNRAGTAHAWEVLMGPATDDRKVAGAALARATKLDADAADAQYLITSLASAAKALGAQCEGVVADIPSFEAVTLATTFVVTTRKLVSRCLQTTWLFRPVRCRVMNLCTLLTAYAHGDFAAMKEAYMKAYYYGALEPGRRRRTTFNAGTIHVPNCVAAAMGEAARLVAFFRLTEMYYRRQHARFTKDSCNKNGVPAIGSSAARVMEYTARRIANPGAPDPHTAKDAIPGGVPVGSTAWLTVFTRQASVCADPCPVSDALILQRCIDALPASSLALSGLEIQGVAGFTMAVISKASLGYVGINAAITTRAIKRREKKIARGKADAAARRKAVAEVKPSEDGDDADSDSVESGDDATPAIVTSKTPKPGKDEALAIVNVRAAGTKDGKRRKRNPNTTPWMQLLIKPPPGQTGQLEYPVCVTLQLKSVSQAHPAAVLAPGGGGPPTPAKAPPGAKRRRAGVDAHVEPESDSDSDGVPGGDDEGGEAGDAGIAVSRRKRVRPAAVAPKASPQNAYKVLVTMRNGGPIINAVVPIAISVFLDAVLSRRKADGAVVPPLVHSFKTQSRMVNVHNPQGVTVRLGTLASAMERGVPTTAPAAAAARKSAADIVLAMATGAMATVSSRAQPRFAWLLPTRGAGCVSVMVALSVGGTAYRPMTINVFADNMNVPGSGGSMLKATAARVVQALLLVIQQQGRKTFVDDPPPAADWAPFHTVNFEPDHDDAAEGVVAAGTTPARPRARGPRKAPPPNMQPLSVTLTDTMGTLVARVRASLWIGPVVPAWPVPAQVVTRSHYQPP